MDSEYSSDLIDYFHVLNRIFSFMNVLNVWFQMMLTICSVIDIILDSFSNLVP
jgi:hypothetical protein